MFLDCTLCTSQKPIILEGTHWEHIVNRQETINFYVISHVTKKHREKQHEIL